MPSPEHREGQSPEQKQLSQASKWDIESARVALNADQGRVEDFLCGEGYRLNIPKISANPPGQLDLFPDAFPDAGLARFRTGVSFIEKI